MDDDENIERMVFENPVFKGQGMNQMNFSFLNQQNQKDEDQTFNLDEEGEKTEKKTLKNENQQNY